MNQDHEKKPAIPENSERIVAAEFNRRCENNPSWIVGLTHPIVVTEFCNAANSPITELSHLIHFTGRNLDGDVAAFSWCTNLNTARGTFHGKVSFTESGIKEIDTHPVTGLIITKPNLFGEAAVFHQCRKLETAQGTFPGYVDFSGAFITKAENLNITKPSGKGWAVSFAGCPELQRIARCNFAGNMELFATGKLVEIKQLKLSYGNPTAENAREEGSLIIVPGRVHEGKSIIHTCANLVRIPKELLDRDDIDIETHLRSRLETEIKNQEKARAAMKGNGPQPEL